MTVLVHLLRFYVCCCLLCVTFIFMSRTRAYNFFEAELQLVTLHDRPNIFGCFHNGDFPIICLDHSCVSKSLTIRFFCPGSFA